MGERTGADGGVPLRVVSYNIHTQRDDTAALAAVVRDLAPDVLIVQEGPRRFRWREKSAALARSVGMVVAAGGLPGLGNLLLTTLRVRVRETAYARYPLTPGRHLRGTFRSDCEVPGARFTVAGAHLATDPAERPAQARLLKEHLAAARHPLILGGDLNDTPGSETWRIVAAGLTDPGDDARATFPCHAPDRRIDAILVDPRITVVRHEVPDTPRVRRASDHFPLVADLLLPPAA